MRRKVFDYMAKVSRNTAELGGDAIDSSRPIIAATLALVTAVFISITCLVRWKNDWEPSDIRYPLYQ